MKPYESVALEYPNVPEKLREFKEAGYALFIVSNQANLANKKIPLETLKKKIEKVSALLGVDAVFLLAGYYDIFRKPSFGSFEYIQSLMKIPLTQDNCFYCGDMTGCRIGIRRKS